MPQEGLFRLYAQSMARLETHAIGTIMVEIIEHQRSMLAALNASKSQLRRDGCGDWRITGTQGYVYADGAGFLLGVTRQSIRGWNAAKKLLPFCRLTQDGDDEGCLHLDRLPDTEEARTIRAVLGIRKRMEYSPDDLARRKQHGVELQARLRAKDRENE
jgi:hypothetical protein